MFYVFRHYIYYAYLKSSYIERKEENLKCGTNKTFNILLKKASNMRNIY